MTTFSLKIIASDKTFYEGKAVSLVIPTIDGEKGILAHHEEMVIAVSIGELRFKLEDNTEHRAVIGSGFAQIANNRVMVLVDSAERPEDIDEKRAEEALERAKEQLRQKQSIQEYHMSQASLARAISRLKGKGIDHINL
ncbi:MAG: ATP synthase F1 subunit epsilon [Lachnospiraceae bacterium]|nr:ATP synthase F1 subunit epsilon [Lachnospiraceae bacterium]